MATKLSLYNGALEDLDERRLASLTEAREPRRVLDDFYDSTVKYCLEQGYWNFAMRAVQADSSSSITPTFGYQYAFTKPEDFVRLYAMSSEPTMRQPLLEFVDEPALWYANVDPLYVKYVSDDTAYGMDLSLWPDTFTNYVELRLALKACKRITGKSASDDLVKAEKRALADARSKDAMNEPPGQMPAGTWVRSRRAGGVNSTDRGLT